MESFHIMDSLGEGSSGIVKLARNKADQSFVAIKVLKDATIEDVLREEGILSTCSHQNIISLLGIHSDWQQDSCAREFFMVFEYMDRGALDTHIAETACRSSSLHSKKIMHLDIKPANVLLNSKGVVKLADFGHATRISCSDKPSPYNLGTLEFKAPELLLGLKSYGPQADIWSVGCVFLQLLLGKIIFEPTDHEESSCSGSSYRQKPSCESQVMDKIITWLGKPKEENWPGVSALPKYDELTACSLAEEGLNDLKSEEADHCNASTQVGLLQGRTTEAGFEYLSYYIPVPATPTCFLLSGKPKSFFLLISMAHPPCYPLCSRKFCSSVAELPVPDILFSETRTSS